MRTLAGTGFQTVFCIVQSFWVFLLFQRSSVGGILYVQPCNLLHTLEHVLNMSPAVGRIALGCGLQPQPLTFFPRVAQHARDQGYAPEAVVVGRDGIRDPARVRVGVDDADGGDVVQAAFVQADFVLQRVEADDQVRFQDGVLALRECLSVLGELLVCDVDDLDGAVAEDLLAVGQAARCPSVEDVVSPC